MLDTHSLVLQHLLNLKKYWKTAGEALNTAGEAGYRWRGGRPLGNRRMMLDDCWVMLGDLWKLTGRCWVDVTATLEGCWKSSRVLRNLETARQG